MASGLPSPAGLAAMAQGTAAGSRGPSPLAPAPIVVVAPEHGERVNAGIAIDEPRLRLGVDLACGRGTEERQQQAGTRGTRPLGPPSSMRRQRPRSPMICLERAIFLRSATQRCARQFARARRAAQRVRAPRSRNRRSPAAPPLIPEGDIWQSARLPFRRRAETKGVAD